MQPTTKISERIAKEYAEIIQQTSRPWCWACGATGQQVPDWWRAPWRIERAHIVNKPRREDRRAVVLLCSGCHTLSHGQRIAGCNLPRLHLPHLLWLKLWRDMEFYDLDWLQKHSIRKLPQPEIIPAELLRMYRQRHPGLPEHAL